MRFLPLANEVAVGNVFTSVCQLFCPRRGLHAFEGSMLAWWGLHAWVCVYGGACMVKGAFACVGEEYKRAVRILLECILVYSDFDRILYCKERDAWNTIQTV